MEPIATLPVFLKLQGRRALLVGGARPAVWKAELLAAAGARASGIAEDACSEMIDLCLARSDAIDHHARAWAEADLAGAAVAVGVLEGEDAKRFRDAAHRAGVPVNIVDVPALCDFQFGTIVSRSPLVIGISTDGAAPVLGQALRARIEALLPAGLDAWVKAAAAWRRDVGGRNLGFAARRRFWERFADAALEGRGRAPTAADRDRFLAQAQVVDAAAQGTLTLVGAGPGDTTLVTLGAVQALQSADVVVFEVDVSERVLGLGRREARRVPVPVDPVGAITAMLAGGSNVVWIGPGDPASCEAWTDRQTALRRLPVEAGIVRGLRCAECPRGCAAQRYRESASAPA